MRSTCELKANLAGTNLLELTLIEYARAGEFLNRYPTIDGAGSDEDPDAARHGLQLSHGIIDTKDPAAFGPLWLR